MKCQACGIDPDEYDDDDQAETGRVAGPLDVLAWATSIPLAVWFLFTLAWWIAPPRTSLQLVYFDGNYHDQLPTLVDVLRWQWQWVVALAHRVY